MLVHARRHAWYLYASTIVALFGLIWVSTSAWAAVSEGRSRWNTTFRSRAACVRRPCNGLYACFDGGRCHDSWQRFVAEARSDDDDAADSNDAKGWSAALKRVLYVAASVALLACWALIVRRAATQRYLIASRIRPHSDGESATGPWRCALRQ